MLKEGIEKAWERLAEGLGRPKIARESQRWFVKAREGPRKPEKAPREPEKAPREPEKAPREPEKAPRAFSGYCKMLQRFVDSSNTQLHPSARHARPPP